MQFGQLKRREFITRLRGVAAPPAIKMKCDPTVHQVTMRTITVQQSWLISRRQFHATS
jgi:hypothetical protein